MAAGGHDLRTAVQHGRGIGRRNDHFLCETHVTAPRAALVRRCAPRHVPSNLVLSVLVLEVPHIFGKSGVLSAASGPERARVGIEPLLEWPLSQPKIEPGGLGGAGDSGLVHYTSCQALPSEGAICWLPAVACSLLVGCRGRSEDLGVMTTYDGGHIVCATVAPLNIVSVEELPVAVLPWEVLVQEL